MINVIDEYKRRVKEESAGTQDLRRSISFISEVHNGGRKTKVSILGADCYCKLEALANVLHKKTDDLIIEITRDWIHDQLKSLNEAGNAPFKSEFDKAYSLVVNKEYKAATKLKANREKKNQAENK